MRAGRDSEASICTERDSWVQNKKSSIALHFDQGNRNKANRKRDKSYAFWSLQTFKYFEMASGGLKFVAKFCAAEIAGISFLKGS